MADLGYRFVLDKNELSASVNEFHSKPEFWRAVLGSSPKYFVHQMVQGEHQFGLSKFVAFNNIEVEEYLSRFRYRTDGGTTQKHIRWLSKVNWTPYSDLSASTQEAFGNWIHEFFPNYNLQNASFIAVSGTSDWTGKTNKSVTPDELQKRLVHQKQIGDVGEQIALEYEVGRLGELGVKNPQKYVEHVAVKSVGAGYDIYSKIRKPKEERFIEVKSTTSDHEGFIITENEVTTLRSLGENAYLYMVRVSDLKNKEGAVVRVVRNPISFIEEQGQLKPIAFKVKLD